MKRHMFLCAVATTALLLAATGVAAAQQTAQTATFDERFSPVMEKQIVSEENLLATFGDTLRTLTVVLRVVGELDRARNQRLADLRAFAHQGGDWETLVLWRVPMREWPVITAVSDEQSTDDMMPGTLYGFAASHSK